MKRIENLTIDKKAISDWYFKNACVISPDDKYSKYESPDGSISISKGTCKEAVDGCMSDLGYSDDLRSDVRMTLAHIAATDDL